MRGLSDLGVSLIRENFRYERKMDSAENGVINIGEEEYCSSWKVSEDIRGNKVYLHLGISWR